MDRGDLQLDDRCWWGLRIAEHVLAEQRWCSGEDN